MKPAPGSPGHPCWPSCPGTPVRTPILKEVQLRKMRIGQARNPLRRHLRRCQLPRQGGGSGAGTGAAFALLPAQNATGNWIKVVQRGARTGLPWTPRNEATFPCGGPVHGAGGYPEDLAPPWPRRPEGKHPRHPRCTRPSLLRRMPASRPSSPPTGRVCQRPKPLGPSPTPDRHLP